MNRGGHPPANQPTSQQTGTTSHKRRNGDNLHGTAFSSAHLIFMTFAGTKQTLEINFYNATKLFIYTATPSIRIVTNEPNLTSPGESPPGHGLFWEYCGRGGIRRLRFVNSIPRFPRMSGRGMGHGTSAILISSPIAVQNF